MRCILLAVFLAAAVPAAAAPDVRLVEGGADRSVVEVRFAPADTAFRALLVAVAPDARPQWRLRSVSWWQDPSGGVDPAALVTSGGVGLARGVGLWRVGIDPAAGGGRASVVVLELDHPAGPRAADLLRRAAGEARWLDEASTEAVPPTVVNPAQYPRWRAAARLAGPPAKSGRSTVPDWFAATPRWVRLEVEETGPYAVSGEQLRDLGVVLAQAHPASLRLYRGGGQMLPKDPTIPDSLQIDRMGLTEVPLAVVDEAGADGEADGTLDLGDRVLFYGFGVDAWRDRIDPAALPLETFEHLYADRGVYWLTWEAAAATSPLPGDPRRIPDQAAPAHPDVPVETEHWTRLHAEQSFASLPGVLEDQWAWEGSVISSLTQTFIAEGAVPGAPATFVVDVRGRRDRYEATFRTRAWLNGDVAHADTLVFGVRAQSDSVRMRLRGESDTVTSGLNSVRFSYDNFGLEGRQERIAFDSFDIRYRQRLDRTLVTGALACYHWADEVAAPGTLVNLGIATRPGEVVRVWDVTSPTDVRRLVPTVAGRQATVGLVREPGTSAHLLVFADDELRPVAAAELAHVRPLRETVGAVDYLIVYHPRFAAAAEALADLRARELPGVAAPAVAAVSVDDVYANFSGGQKDVLAIRNFLRWNYYAHGQRLRYACVVGDASLDHRNYLRHDPDTQLYDFLPAPLVVSFPQVPGTVGDNFPFVSDDELVSFDLPDDDVPEYYRHFDLPDVALGRLVATTAAGAQEMVERIRAYAEEPPAGPWRNRGVFCADDLHRPSLGDGIAFEAAHTRQAEDLARDYLPASIDLEKIYLLEYPLVGLYKPAARAELLRRLNAGQTMFYYVGHGSPGNLADEQVMLGSDAASLTNGDMRFLFLALSCDVAVFADPTRQSMAEEMVAARDGGAIGAIAATYLTTSGSNNLLSDYLFAALFPGRHVVATATVGEALRAAKASLWENEKWSSLRNGRRYPFLGDPALHLPHPVDDLAFAEGSMDSLLTGRRHEVRLDLAALGVAPGPGAAYDLRVEDSAKDLPYSTPHVWRQFGHTAFRGTGPVAGDALAVPFLAPLQMRRGELGRVRLIVDDGERERAAVLAVPVASASVVTSDVVGPQVDLGFAGRRTRVQPGAELRADLQDTSGINILGANPGNSLLLEFDDSGLPIDVTDRFSFLPGSYTRGRLGVDLPGDLAVGEHRAVLTASDMFGNVGEDTLSFALDAAGLVEIFDATVFPNPTPGPCRLVCEVSGAMDLQWDIYTVSGRRLRSLRESAPAAGPLILAWDGRDGEGDPIANGVYLYVLRGTATADAGHPIRKTGQLVIMR